jgi:hypothetical protein
MTDLEQGRSGDHPTSFWYLVLFAFGYAARELFPVSLRKLSWTCVRRCFPTLLNVFSIALLVFVAITSGGFVLGALSYFKKVIPAKDVLMEIYAAGGPGRIPKFETRHIEAVSGIREESGAYVFPEAGAVGASAPLARAYGYNDIMWWFYRKDGAKADHMTDGRTVSPGDPVLRGIRLLWTRDPSRALLQGSDPEIIVSSKLLSDLGYSFPDPPEYLLIDYQVDDGKEGVRARIPIVAVSDALPRGDFLACDDFYALVRDRHWDYPPMYERASIGAFGSREEAAAFLGKAANLTERNRTETEIRLQEAEWWVHLRFGVKKNGIWIQETFFPQVLRMTGTAASGGSPNLRLGERIPAPKSWHALDQKGYGVDKSLLSQVLFLRKIRQFGSVFMASLSLIVGLLCLCNLLLSFSLLICQRIPQIGLMKAAGASFWFVIALYALEATLLWASAAAVALPASQVSGPLIERGLFYLGQFQERAGDPTKSVGFETTAGPGSAAALSAAGGGSSGGKSTSSAGAAPVGREPGPENGPTTRLFQPTWLLRSIVLAGTWLLAVLTTVVAVWWAARIEPAVAVRYRE